MTDKIASLLLRARDALIATGWTNQYRELIAELSMAGAQVSVAANSPPENPAGPASLPPVQESCSVCGTNPSNQVHGNLWLCVACLIELLEDHPRTIYQITNGHSFNTQPRAFLEALHECAAALLASQQERIAELEQRLAGAHGGQRKFPTASQEAPAGEHASLPPIAKRLLETADFISRSGIVLGSDDEVRELFRRSMRLHLEAAALLSSLSEDKARLERDNADLQTDVNRYVTISAQVTTENEQLQQSLAAARAALRPFAAAYNSLPPAGSVSTIEYLHAWQRAVGSVTPEQWECAALAGKEGA